MISSLTVLFKLGFVSSRYFRSIWRKITNRLLRSRSGNIFLFCNMLSDFFSPGLTRGDGFGPTEVIAAIGERVLKCVFWFYVGLVSWGLVA
mmetsp:Transcript_18160/g.24992  ORF Transcript_18160/g.24992 Transcript_18160/m.24992 type:complete len:91 (+) Transcript_18160:440-712(+)